MATAVAAASAVKARLLRCTTWLDKAEAVAAFGTVEQDQKYTAVAILERVGLLRNAAARTMLAKCEASLA